MFSSIKHKTNWLQQTYGFKKCTLCLKKIKWNAKSNNFSSGSNETQLATYLLATEICLDTRLNLNSFMMCRVLSKVVRRYNVLLKPLLIMTQVFFKDHVKTLNHPTRAERRKAGISRLKKKCRNSPVIFLKDGKIQWKKSKRHNPN